MMKPLRARNVTYQEVVSMGAPPTSLVELMSAARAGSPEALNELARTCRPWLIRLARVNLDPQIAAKGDSSDLVQETLLEFYRDFSTFQGAAEGELLAWLRCLLLNNRANFARRYRGTSKRNVAREVPLPDGSGGDWRREAPRARDPSPYDRLEAQEQADLLLSALQRLPEDYRQVLLFRYQDQRGFDEISLHMHRSSNAVRKLWARAVKALEQEMKRP